MSSMLKLLKVLHKQICKDYENFIKRPDDERTLNYIKIQLAILEDTYKASFDCNITRGQVVPSKDPAKDAAREEELDEIFQNIKETYLEYRIALLDTLEKLQKPAETSVSAVKPHKDNDKNALRLPKINLPTFSGNYESWKSFHDLFSSLIHNNKSLSEIEKMHYLKSSLIDEADRLLQHLSVDSGNYEKAWEILTSRYDHRRLLVNAQFKLFFGQAVLQQESSAGLKSLLDTSTECRHAFKNLELPVDHWDSILIYCILQKLPPLTQQLWEEKLGTKADTKKLPNFKEFSEFLETRFRTLEVVDQQGQRTQLTGNKNLSHRTPNSTRSNSFHLRSKRRDEFSCKVCDKGQHALRTCKRFLKMDISSRQGIIRRIGVCENCLAYSHSTQQCPSRVRCYFCQQPHHSLLHYSNSPHTNNQPGSSHPYIHSHSHAQPIAHSSNHTTHNPIQSIRSPHNSEVHSHTNTQHMRAPNQTHSYQVSTINPHVPAFTPTDRVQEASVNNPTVNTFHSLHHPNTEVLLATALIKVKAATGRFLHLRALVDPGSEATFITEAAVQSLNLKTRRTFIEVSGLGKVRSETCHRCVDISFGSLNSRFESCTRALVYRSLTGLLPANQLTTNNWNHLKGLTLADPFFHKPAKIDLLLGSDVFSEIVLPEIERAEEQTAPIAQKTELGWIVLGRVPTEHPRRVHSFVQVVDLDAQLRKFWEIEEAPFEKYEAREDRACEEQFAARTRRTSSGRFQVSLPFREGSHPALGSSKEGALRRFLQLERRFQKNPTLYKEYKACIKEYSQLGQMEEVDVSTDEVLATPYHYFLPHHAVFKESSSTTKLRVVFDAASKTSDGTSLNEHLLVGPKIQNNIIDIILRWRKHKYTFTSDIEKMYRQVRVDHPDTYYQLIFWRDSAQDPIRTFRLETVTFGTTCAPYLAIRTIKQLASDEEARYPIGAKAVLEDMYVDDLISGADSVEEGLLKREEVRQLLSSAGFHLRKWTSNSNELLCQIPESDREVDFSLPLGASEHVKALGIKWFPLQDSFSFQNVCSDDSQVTKRTILSSTAKLFDPLGWISPCVVKAKMLMQQLWCRGLDWDTPIPSELVKTWQHFREQLPLLERIRIPRWVRTHNTQKDLELHGFSDASERAYGAVVYLRVLDVEDKIHLHLLLSKTKVAPLKTVSLPRLELCGAVILAGLIDYTSTVLGLQNVRKFAWTDSTIALSWISAPPSKWTTFVSNRVAEIQRLTKTSSWKHIPSHLNPADLASRGVLPGELEGNNLWWNGPDFLHTDWNFVCPIQPTTLHTVEEQRSVRSHCAIKEQNDIMRLILRHSRLQKLIRIIAICKRFTSNSRQNLDSRNLSSLSPKELHAATLLAVRTVQNTMFSEEIEGLKTTSHKRFLSSLNPFLDSDGILRVGGRLQHSNLSYEQQHPIILSANHHFSKLLIADAHEKTLHGGSQQVISFLRNQYWILNIKNSVKKCIHSCNICFRYRAKPAQQIMGNLPAPRVRISKPFTNTGVDYAGPTDVKAWKGRGSKTFKAYFAIFVCLATKAIHIELVSDMTTQAFLAALRRFTSRRGLCAQIYSDCGTNFVGANTELQKLLRAAQMDWKEIATTIANEGIKWNFIPPASPHFGGLWEAGVKSIKHHLKRIIGLETFTFEELTTLLAQVEACLNSRPLCPMTNDADDLTTLTPGHFLIGQPLNSIPHPDLEEEKVGCLDRWNRIQKLQQLFWKKWSSEYLARLQQRPKWLNVKPQPTIGDLVLVRDERLPPSKWCLGRITNTHPGSDNLTRVVTLKTQNGEIKRPLTKICPLPSNDTVAEDIIN